MRYHKFRFRRLLIGNLKILLCKIFGHRINNKPTHQWCERCGLAYSECYKPLEYDLENIEYYRDILFKIQKDEEQAKN